MTICACDSFCCTDMWDDLCAGEGIDGRCGAALLCQICDVDPGDGDCCVANGTPGCGVAECETLICASDAFCCDIEWDGDCADAANEQCGLCDDDKGDPDDPGGSDCCVANGTPGCEEAECETLICASDPFCCDTAWDGICAGDANEQCDVCDDDKGDPGEPGDGDCCVANGTPGCGEAECETLICASDPFCCDTAWDGICADAANEQCDLCDDDKGDPGDPDDGDCCVAGGTPGCGDAECQATICADDPFCCDVEWDSICAGNASDDCDVCN